MKRTASCTRSTGMREKMSDATASCGAVQLVHAVQYRANCRNLVVHTRREGAVFQQQTDVHVAKGGAVQWSVAKTGAHATRVPHAPACSRAGKVGSVTVPWPS